MEEPQSVRVFLKNGRTQTFSNTNYQADFRTGVLSVYRPFGEEREELTQFDLNTVRYYEYVIEK